MKFASLPKHTDPKAVDNAHHNALLAKLMYGKFFTQQKEVPGVDLDQSHMWLCQAGLRGKTEAALCTAQDQAMATNFVRHKIYKKAHKKTIPHIASGCDMLRGTKYVERHNKDEGRSVVPNWKQHKAEETTSISLGAGCTLMYNMTQK
eukprot:13315117-Ditylum_brightwellii.AAC.1